MAEGYLQQTALAVLGLRARADADAAKADAGVWIGESGNRGQLTLRGNSESTAFQQAVKKATGVEPPTAPNTATEAGDGLRILWLGPDEWLAVTPAQRKSDTITALRGTLKGLHAAVTDTSDSRTVITVAGPHARETLLKGCSLDLHARHFAAGACAQTTLARASVILHCTDAAPQYDVYVHRSFAAYLWTWIEDAAAEYGFRVTTE